MNIDVTPSFALVALAAVLVGTGVYLMLERTLTRIVIGVGIAGNGVNVLLMIAGGRAGRPPLNDGGSADGMADPLPQALTLTAIVITLATIAFGLAMAYRSWQLNGHDEVQDDLEDRRLARRAAADVVSERTSDDSGSTLAEDALLTRDETVTDAEDLADLGRPEEPFSPVAPHAEEESAEEPAEPRYEPADDGEDSAETAEGETGEDDVEGEPRQGESGLGEDAPDATDDPAQANDAGEGGTEPQESDAATDVAEEGLGREGER